MTGDKREKTPLVKANLDASEARLKAERCCFDKQ